VTDAVHSWFEVIVRGSPSVREAVARWLFQRGVTALEERDVGAVSELVVVAQTQSKADALARDIAGVDEGGERPVCLVHERVDAGWRTRWALDLRPVALTNRVVVCPDHSAAPDVAPPSRVVQLATELAFGFGEHATTRVAARALAAEVERRGAQLAPTVLDVGCGTGVLAFVAACHGASGCFGVDHEPVAVAVARKNATHNDLSSACRFGVDSVEDLVDEFDVVTANVELLTLVRLAPAMLRLCRSGGAIVVAGFLRGDVGDVLRAFGRPVLSRTHTEDDWVALTLVPDPAAGSVREAR